MTINQATLDRLDAIYKEGGTVPEGLDAYAFTQEILPLLGSTDGPLRERKTLGVIYTWVARRELTDAQLKDLVHTLIDEEHLFLGIESPGSDDVYMRAFAVFILTAFVQAHQKQPYLSADEISNLKAAVIRYLESEEDLRGYISTETWWAHCVAHAADVVRDLAGCEELGAEDLFELLEACGKALLTDSTVFIFEEDTRIAEAVLAILKRRLLTERRVAAWSKSLVPEARWTGELPGVHHRFVNARNLLRCLIHQGRAAGLERSILDTFEAAHEALPHR